MINIKDISIDGLARINAQYASRDKCDYFSVTPRIVHADKKTTITIQSKDESMSLSGTFSVFIFPYYEYDYQPFEENVCEMKEVTAQDGII